MQPEHPQTPAYPDQVSTSPLGAWLCHLLLFMLLSVPLHIFVYQMHELMSILRFSGMPISNVDTYGIGITIMCTFYVHFFQKSA